MSATHRQRPYRQVDVFTATPYHGNPLAVVLDGQGLSDEEMQHFARWTNLSETTFLLPPTQAGADYRVRIFTPGAELPFAGHPTLGSCHAWLQSGGAPKNPEHIVQECAVGLVSIRRAGQNSARSGSICSRSPATSMIAGVPSTSTRSAGGVGCLRRTFEFGHHPRDPVSHLLGRYLLADARGEQRKCERRRMPGRHQAQALLPHPGEGCLEPDHVEFVAHHLDPCLREEQVARIMFLEYVVQQAGARLQFARPLRLPGEAGEHQPGHPRNLAELTPRELAGVQALQQVMLQVPCVEQATGERR